MRLTRLCAIVAAATVVLFTSQFILEVYLNYEEPWLISDIYVNTSGDLSAIFEEVTDPVIIWWAPLGGIGNFRRRSQCGHLFCVFTDFKYYHHHPNLKGFLFYGSFINWTQLPLPRNESVFWGLLHEESPRNNIPLGHATAFSLFNYTSTFSRHSDVPLTTQYLTDINALTDMKFFETAKAKNGYQKNESWVVAPIVYIQTDCNTPLDRDSYVVELSKYIRIDSFGSCLHNRSLPPHLQAPFNMRTMMSDDLLNIVGKYKFAIAIENGVCDDYITEKLWRPLIAGTVPIYIGSPTVSDWLPNNRSAILGLEFESPKHLAEYLQYLNSNDEEYDSYRSHKLKFSVTNSQLIREMEERGYSSQTSQHDISDGISFVNKFECFVCEKAHNKIKDEISIATKQQYSCEMPTSVVTRKPNVTNDWLSFWFYGRCEAQVVRDFIDSGVANYTVEEYNEALKELINKNKCSYTEENAKEYYLERLQI